jgi:hypothetical protein
MTTTLRQVPEVRFGLGHFSILVAVAAITVLGVAPHPALLAMLLVTVVWASRLPLGLATALGGVAWAYYTGFVVNELGQLTFGTADLMRLILLLVVAAAAHWSR